MQLKDSSYKSSETITQSVEQNTETLAVEAIQTWLVNQISKQLSISANTIKVQEPLTRYGLDSIDSVTIVGDLEDWLSEDLPSTLLWDYPTIEKAAQYLVQEAGVTPAIGSEPQAAVVPVAKEATAGKGWGGIWNRGR